MIFGMETKRKKKALTLLEVMISLSLMAVIITFIFSAFRQVTVANVKIQSAREVVLINKTIEQRLCRLFANIHVEKEVPIDKNAKEKPPSFYTESTADSNGLALFMESLNGVDPDSDFCDLVKTQLYLSKKNELCLVTIGKSGEQRKEVLKDNVGELTFNFFDPVTRELLNSWDEKLEGLPIIIELVLKKKSSDKDPLEFAFMLPTDEKGIIYKKPFGGI